MTYTYRLLDPRPSARERELDFLRSTPVLGVEVTVPELAAACQLGNIDPQHTGGDPNTAAIEAALDWPLPPAGTVLATVRRDADALGAMAVLGLRAEGLDLQQPRTKVVSQPTAERAGEVTSGHTLARYWQETDGTWSYEDDDIMIYDDPMPANLLGHGLTEEELWVRLHLHFGVTPADQAGRIGVEDRTASGWTPGQPGLEWANELDALKSVCLGGRHTVDEAVARVGEFLLAGHFAGEKEEIAQVIRERDEHAAVSAAITVAAEGRIAVVESTSRFAVQAAYRHADVVVAVNPEFRRPGAAQDELPHRKVTIGQQRPGLVDLSAVFAALGAGWGGSPTVGGSPQGVACGIPTQEIVATVERHLAASR